MHDEYTIKPGGCQPLVDLGANGKPRPWRKHHTEGLMLSELYETLGTDPDTPDAARYLDKARRLAGCAPFAEFERLPDGALHLHT